MTAKLTRILVVGMNQVFVADVGGKRAVCLPEPDASSAELELVLVAFFSRSHTLSLFFFAAVRSQGNSFYFRSNAQRSHSLIFCKVSSQKSVQAHGVNYTHNSFFSKFLFFKAAYQYDRVP